ncbi:MAG TPA: pantoate--beta-alanine ligase [Acidimicrobiales bacterium]|nr:pantoate--beta-alanine ligase [Acidimicrobiales bacterium]
MSDLITTIAELRARLDAERAAGRLVGFVPTMGYLHDGHAALVRAARAECDVVVTSIFVNPLQFAPEEDLAAYPRDLERDLAIIGAAGGDLVFHPDGDEMYPAPVATTVTVAGLSERFEGASRPTHFAGVATVVTKLFAIVGPCRAYLGEKDYQQLAVVRRLAADLSLPVEVVGVPIVREVDGLAMSSRNVYLSEAERAAAPSLYAALCAGRDAVLAGTTDAATVEAAMRAVVDAAPLIDLDYAAVVDAATLTPVGHLVGEVRLLIAGRLGRPRLLDNIGVTVPTTRPAGASGAVADVTDRDG